MRTLTIDSRLEAIAGEPAGMLVGPGPKNVQLSGFSPYGDRVLFVVFDRPAAPTFSQDIAGLVDGLRIQQHPTDPLRATWNAAGGPDQNLSIINPPLTGRIAAFISVSGGATVGRAGVLGSPVQTRSITPGIGMTNPPTLKAFSSSEWTVRIIAAYSKALTAYQEQAIMRKLLSMSGA